jgi:hypothetical protein
MLKNDFTHSQKTLPILLSISLTTLAFCATASSSSAETPPQPDTTPLELNLLVQPNSSVVTSETINPKSLTIPSLWLAKANTENRLLDKWIAYPPKNEQQPGRVDLIVNQQIWSLLDYLERYDFVNRLGTIARGFTYNTRVFNYQQEPLASYSCKFANTPYLCRIQIGNRSSLNLLH